jgi:hypothetical protein
VVALGELVARPHVVVEQPAVVDDAGDQPHVVAARRVEHQLARPRLERVEDHHRPVDPVAEPLHAVDQVEREAVRRPGRDAERAGQSGLPHRCHPVPHALVGVARAVGVVEQENVERVDPDPLEAALDRHPDVARVCVRSAQRRIGEARVALRALPVSGVEIVADRAYQLVIRARQAVQRMTENGVCFSGAVGVRGDHRRDASARAQQALQARFVKRLAEMHEAATAPRPEGGMA